MKKTAIILAIVLMVGLTGGCTKNKNNTGQDMMEKMQQSVEHGIDTSQFIGEEKAKELALAKAEITADGVNFDRIELDRDHGVWEYETEFRHNGIEYEVEINAETGEIIKFEKDND